MMSKKILTYLFTLLYLTAMVKPVFPVLDYVINQDYIAEVFCINKDNPMLNCDGKCYLAKMIQEQQSEDQHQDIPSADLREYPIGFIDILDYSFVKSTDIVTTISFYRNLYEERVIPAVFHPPNTLS